jgi:hypothetical protein
VLPPVGHSVVSGLVERCAAFRRNASPWWPLNITGLLEQGDVLGRAIGGVGPHHARGVFVIEYRAKLGAVMGRSVGQAEAPHEAVMAIDANMEDCGALIDAPGIDTKPICAKRAILSKMCPSSDVILGAPGSRLISPKPWTLRAAARRNDTAALAGCRSVSRRRSWCPTRRDAS